MYINGINVIRRRILYVRERVYIYVLTYIVEYYVRGESKCGRQK